MTAALLLALTACGGGSDDGDAKAPATSAPTETSSAPAVEQEDGPEAALEESFRTYVDAFFTGDGATAYELLSERCQASQPLSDVAALAESAAELYGEVDYTIDSVTVNGNEGQVDATYAVEALNSGGGGSTWVLEDGTWRTDKCD